uniref:Retinol dehydrogenase 12 n=1 Tax=Melanaphis sacchari TaxID=742174 RepID=A0A2H8TH63_9HEMI
MFSGKCTSAARLDGKTAIITGSNTGIGKVTAKEFYRIGAKVIVACRDVKKAEQAVTEIVADVKGDNLGQLVVEELDLASFASIKRCAKNILQKEKNIHLLVNNAGVMACPKSKTQDGFETQFGVNHLGHFLFTSLLLPKIRNSTPARIVNVSSMAHTRGVINFEDINYDANYSAMVAYSQSKLANVLFSKELSKRLEGTGVHVYSLHPGLVKTELGRTIDQVYFPGMRFIARFFLYPWMKTPEQGAQTTLHCSIDEKAGEENGLYYSDCKVKEPSALAKDPELAKKLWETSIEMVGLKDYDMFKCSGDSLPEPLKDV